MSTIFLLRRVRVSDPTGAASAISSPLSEISFYTTIECDCYTLYS